jgi:hypothetical protein
MLGLEQWNSTLSSITGTLVRGTERVTSSALFNALEVGPDPSTRQKVGKRLVSHMRRLGWNGPRAMRIPGTTGAVQGYWRRPGECMALWLLPPAQRAGMPQGPDCNSLASGVGSSASVCERLPTIDR